MFGRYMRLVPAGHRGLIKRHGVRRPNWFVGAAEQPSVPRDPSLRTDIDAVKAELHGHAEPKRVDDVPAPSTAAARGPQAAKR